MNTFDIIATTLAPLAGKRLIDIGCGKGALAAALVRAGADVTGIDPAPTAIDDARKIAPKVTFKIGAAENLPCGDGIFDAAIFSNSLHHVPVEAMMRALVEARRVTKLGGNLIVIEPLVTSSFNAVLKLINDEGVVRTAAQTVLRDLESNPGFHGHVSISFDREESFLNFEAFVVRATSADPSRHAIVARDRDKIVSVFEREAMVADGRFVLGEAYKADVFTTS